MSLSTIRLPKMILVLTCAALLLFISVNLVQISAIRETSLAYETINVRHTISGFPCQKGAMCTNKNYDEFYCYTEGSLWEKCCLTEHGPHRCQQKAGTDNNLTFCATAKNGADVEESQCRVKPLTMTLSGRKCAHNSYCGFNNERYQWCWLDEGHTEWEHCCMPGAQCKSTTNENGHTFDACTSCKDITRNCGRNCHYTRCTEKNYPCNKAPMMRSVHNYQCLSPCNHDDTWYAWCWVEPNKGAWDWCCFLGESCGSVLPSDREGSSSCYTKEDHGWPMECRVRDEPTPVPSDYKSPATPLGDGAIFGIVFGSFLILVGILGCYCRRHCC